MLQPGDSFGDYRVLKLLGKGGMGSVFLLENAEGGQVAAKILDPATAGDHESRKRFLREAELAIGVQHPNLVETYDVGEDPETGFCYILMEYAPNGSLADRIKAGPLSVHDAIGITYQIASVLELARQKGIVHRDIKPGNILFGADGKAKLADLGIARGGIAGTETTTVTQTGMMIGTPAYMAPEQMLDAHHVDTRADIYSLGIVFYEMLVGKRPNADDTVVQLMAKAVAGEPIPDVRTMRPEVSAAVAELISLMCAMKADERVQTPAEVTTAISQIVHGREVTIMRKRPSAVVKKPATTGGDSSRRVVMAVFGLIAVVGVAALAYFGSRGRHSAMSPSIVTRTNAVEKIVEKVVERTLVVTNRVVLTGGADTPSSLSKGDDLVKTVAVGKYIWRYVLKENGAVVCAGSDLGIGTGATPCIEPEPTDELTIPFSLEGHKVVAIGKKAFAHCTHVTRVVVPEGVRELGAMSFWDCRNLMEISLPKTLYRVGYEAFRGCQMLRSLDLRKCSSVDGAAFFECKSIESFAVSDDNPSFTAVDGVLYSRNGCILVAYPKDRKNLSLLPYVQIVGRGAFMSCSLSGDIVLPDGIRRVEGEAFSWCLNLRSVTFGHGVEEVGSYVFSGCRRGLSRVEFPASLRRIGEGLFCQCKDLRYVYFNGDAPVFKSSGRSVLGSQLSDFEIVVCMGSKGWMNRDSPELPPVWPVGEGENSRRIRCRGEK